jgi:holo-[acyl-carrier protein] synthase
VIIGIGHDIVEIGRISRVLEGTSEQRFMRRVLTDAEFAVALVRTNRAEYVAGRFAAKEALVKALGCGIGATIGFRDIEIVPDAVGKPGCRLSLEAWSRMGFEREFYRLHLTITHERLLASAFAVVESL